MAVAVSGFEFTNGSWYTCYKLCISDDKIVANIRHNTSTTDSGTQLLNVTILYINSKFCKSS